MINLKKLFLFFSLYIALIEPSIVLGTDRSIFPSSRMGGGTRGECASRLIIHVVPLENIYSPDKKNLLALYLGKTKDAKPLSIYFNNLNTSEQYEEILIDPMEESLLIFKIPKQLNDVMWNTQFNCAETEYNNSFDFISNNSNPVSTLITFVNNKENHKYQKFISQAYEKCGSRVSSLEIKSLMNLEDNTIKELSKSFSIVCL